jgi:hypothetical protein
MDFMITSTFDPTKWAPLALKDQADTKSKKAHLWLNHQGFLSPLQFYEYLTMRFGPPNGIAMLFKNASSDNLIHWQYALVAPGAVIHIWGKTTCVEISVSMEETKEIAGTDWQALVNNLQAEFKKHAKQMKTVQATFEHWSLFINPFARVEHTIKDYMHQLERLKLEEPAPYAAGSKKDFERYTGELDRWTKNITKAASLGTTIRMHCPVMAEAFINLVILVFRNADLAKDERVYENFLRQPIDIRIKTLHMNCTCFPQQLNCSGGAFKNFHTLMNGRNDVLHGNIVPKKLFVEDVWFDQRFIPLFQKDEGVIVKMLRNYCTHVEKDKAQADFQIVSDIIELILMGMDDDSMRLFMQIMGDRMPGINNKTGRLGTLFPQGPMVESFIGYKND